MRTLIELSFLRNAAQRNKVTQDWIYWNFKSNLSKKKMVENVERRKNEEKKYKHKLHLAFFLFLNVTIYNK